MLLSQQEGSTQLDVLTNPFPQPQIHLLKCYDSNKPYIFTKGETKVPPPKGTLLAKVIFLHRRRMLTYRVGINHMVHPHLYPKENKPLTVKLQFFTHKEATE